VLHDCQNGGLLGHLAEVDQLCDELANCCCAAASRGRQRPEKKCNG
jgi:hypothetical protein